MHDNCYTYMHALHYSYGMMQCINIYIYVIISIDIDMDIPRS